MLDCDGVRERVLDRVSGNLHLAADVADRIAQAENAVLDLIAANQQRVDVERTSHVERIEVRTIVGRAGSDRVHLQESRVGELGGEDIGETEAEVVVLAGRTDVPKGQNGDRAHMPRFDATVGLVPQGPKQNGTGRRKDEQRDHQPALPPGPHRGGCRCDLVVYSLTRLAGVLPDPFELDSGDLWPSAIDRPGLWRGTCARAVQTWGA